ncbi:MAG: D-alanine--D-alanine ligase [Chloroflexi bacterium]|nr:D-alanine--D-alanine ligase [Chloroflexota bacterium]
MKRKIRVGVVFGGRSAEHEVSLASAAAVMGALDKEKYEVVPIGVTRNGRWLTSGDPLKALKEGNFFASKEMALLGDPGLLTSKEKGQPRAPAVVEQIDVLFPVLHGPYGEDGTVQGLFELAGLPYVGAGVLASALGMDKAVMKAVFRQHGLPVLDHVVIKRRDWERNPESAIQRVEDALDYPCFCKPANLGSSIGVSKARNRAELEAGLALAAGYDRKLLVERAVESCREVECSVLGNDDPSASGVGEIVPKREFYDYVAKYSDENTELIIPARLPEEMAKRVQTLAVQAFLAIDCAGMARVDFFVTRDNTAVYVNEINTIPGFTAVSMYPKLWEAAGLSFPALVDRLVELALERHEDKARNKTW